MKDTKRIATDKKVFGLMYSSSVFVGHKMGYFG